MTNIGFPDKDTPFKIISNDVNNLFFLIDIFSFFQYLSTLDEDDSDEDVLPKLPPPFPRKDPNDILGDSDDDDDSDNDDDDLNDHVVLVGFNSLKGFHIRNGAFVFRELFGDKVLFRESNIEDDSEDLSDTVESEEIIAKMRALKNKLPPIEEESSESSASDETSSDDDDGSSSNSDSNSNSNSDSDSDSASEEVLRPVEITGEIDISERRAMAATLSRFSQTVIFFIILGVKFAIIYFVVTRCCYRPGHQHKTITILNIPEISCEDKNVLVRAVGFLEDKYRHNGKYQRMVGEDV